MSIIWTMSHLRCTLHELPPCLLSVFPHTDPGLCIQEENPMSQLLLDRDENVQHGHQMSHFRPLPPPQVPTLSRVFFSSFSNSAMMFIHHSSCQVLWSHYWWSFKSVALSDWNALFSPHSQPLLFGDRTCNKQKHIKYVCPIWGMILTTGDSPPNLSRGMPGLLHEDSSPCWTLCWNVFALFDFFYQKDKDPITDCLYIHIYNIYMTKVIPSYVFLCNLPSLEISFLSLFYVNSLQFIFIAL